MSWGEFPDSQPYAGVVMSDIVALTITVIELRGTDETVTQWRHSYAL